MQVRCDKFDNLAYSISNNKYYLGAQHEQLTTSPQIQLHRLLETQPFRPRWKHGNFLFSLLILLNGERHLLLLTPSLSSVIFLYDST